MAEMTATVAETRANFSKIAATVRETGRPVTVFKNSKPWVLVAPIESGYGDHIPSIDWAKQDVVRVDPETRRPFCLPIGTTKRTTESTMPSHDPKPGEIWLAYVEFLDHPGIGKVRPAF